MAGAAEEILGFLDLPDLSFLFLNNSVSMSVCSSSLFKTSAWNKAVIFCCSLAILVKLASIVTSSSVLLSGFVTSFAFASDSSVLTNEMKWGSINRNRLGLAIFLSLVQVNQALI